MKLKHLIHPIRSARRLEELEDRAHELEILLRDDHQWLAHDPTANALTKRYLNMAIDSWGSYAPMAIDQLRNHLGINPYRSRQIEALPDGMALVPRTITAESGHKSALMGEFSEEVELPCPECYGRDEEDDDCEICHGGGEYSVRVYVDWTTIKAIHRRVVDVAEGSQ